MDTELDPLVLVENERTVEGKYDFWEDLTGERYHFPNQYRNKMKKGRRFVYYRGIRRLHNKRGTAEYFGCGRIGEMERDTSVSRSERKRDWKWYCDIEDYAKFPETVPAKIEGRPFENIANSMGWRNGVRVITDEIYNQILKNSGISGTTIRTTPSNLNQARKKLVVVKMGLLRNRFNKAKGLAWGGKRYNTKEAKRIGDKAEKIVFDHLRSQYDDVVWDANENEFPGYDIHYESEGVVHAVEVKGTKGSEFSSIEITANEWNAAQQLRAHYDLCLVAEVFGNSPKLQFVNDPYGLVEQGEADASPVKWKFILTSST